MYVPQSSTLKLYMEKGFPSIDRKMALLTDEQLAICDGIYQWAMAEYSNGGDTIIECFEPWTLLERFKTLNDVREYCGLKREQMEDAQNA